MTDQPKPSPEALAAADAICTRHGMLPGGFMRDSLAEALDAFALERAREDPELLKESGYVDGMLWVGPIGPIGRSRP